MPRQLCCRGMCKICSNQNFTKIIPPKISLNGENSSVRWAAFAWCLAFKHKKQMKNQQGTWNWSIFHQWNLHNTKPEHRNHRSINSKWGKLFTLYYIPESILTQMKIFIESVLFCPQDTMRVSHVRRCGECEVLSEYNMVHLHFLQNTGEPVHNETREVLLKTHKFHHLPGPVFPNSCLFSLPWKTTCLERPQNLVVMLYRFHCTYFKTLPSQPTIFLSRYGTSFMSPMSALWLIMFIICGMQYPVTLNHI